MTSDRVDIYKIKLIDMIYRKLSYIVKPIRRIKRKTSFFQKQKREVEWWNQKDKKGKTNKTRYE